MKKILQNAVLEVQDVLVTISKKNHPSISTDAYTDALKPYVEKEEYVSNGTQSIIDGFNIFLGNINYFDFERLKLQIQNFAKRIQNLTYILNELVNEGIETLAEAIIDRLEANDDIDKLKNVIEVLGVDLKEKENITEDNVGNLMLDFVQNTEQKIAKNYKEYLQNDFEKIKESLDIVKTSKNPPAQTAGSPIISLRDSESGYLFAIQAGRIFYYMRSYCARGKPSSRVFVWDFTASVGAVWVIWAAGLLSESAVSRALVSVVATSVAVAGFWFVSDLAKTDPSFRVAASATVIILAIPLFFSK